MEALLKFLRGCRPEIYPKPVFQFFWNNFKRGRPKKYKLVYVVFFTKIMLQIYLLFRSSWATNLGYTIKNKMTRVDTYSPTLSLPHFPAPRYEGSYTLVF